MRINTFKLLGLGAMALGGVATLLSNFASSKEQEAIIEEKVNEALAAKETEDEES